MYALARNAWKYRARDKRVRKEQLLEFDYLAPDTIEEIFDGLALLEEWTGRAALRDQGKSLEGVSTKEMRREGKHVLAELPGEVARLTVFGERVENSRRPVLVLKPAEAYATYREMVSFYGVKTLMAYSHEHRLSFEELLEHMGIEPRGGWINVGGQLLRETDVDSLRQSIVAGDIGGWQEVHGEYARLAELYPVLKARHAFASLLDIEEMETDQFTPARWHTLLAAADSTMRRLNTLTRESRVKDYSNPFRLITYDSKEEMGAVVGTIEDDAFITQIAVETETFAKRVEEVRKLG